MNAALLLSLLLASAARPLDESPKPGWTRQPTALLLYGDDGSLAAELPLREPDISAAASHETLGGVSPDGRVAWTLDRRQRWNQGRTKLLESRRLFKAYGTSGQELWRDETVDLPERGDPAQFSADGKLLLLARHPGDGWSAEERTWLGQPLLTIGPFPRLVAMAITPNGRYALARWGVPDKSDTHTFIDLTTKERKDIPSEDLILGQARVGDDGSVRTGAKTIFTFAVAAAPAVSSAPAISTSAAPAPPAAR